MPNPLDIVMESLALIIVEAAMELVPEEVARHPSVRKHAARRNKRPTELILDRSYHHSAMLKLKDAHKRGRPDIVYHILLDSVNSPLYKAGLLELYVDTIDGHIITLGKGVRLPRSYDRFIGLIEDLYVKGEIVSGDGERLLKMYARPLNWLLERLAPDYAVLMTERGDLKGYGDVAEALMGRRRPAVGIGGFPSGDFGEGTLSLFDSKVSIGPERYDASLVACRLIYEVERRYLDGVTN